MEQFISIYEQQLENFKDIEIIGFEDRRSHASGQGSLYSLYLTLSITPKSTWISLFNKSREHPRHSMWRRAHIEGTHIVILCPLDELEKYHIKDLKEDVKRANQGYRTYLRRCIEEDKHHQQYQKEERDKLESLKKSLDFEDEKE